MAKAVLMAINFEKMHIRWWFFTSGSDRGMLNTTGGCQQPYGSANIKKKELKKIMPDYGFMITGDKEACKLYSKACYEFEKAKRKAYGVDLNDDNS